MFACWIVSGSAAGQDLSFFHIDKSDGLSDNRVQCTVTDKNGLLWIGTRNGLNNYDGYRVKNYYSRDYPGLPNDQIVRMVCDPKNRIWIQCRNGMLALLDEKRRFRTMNIAENGKKIRVDYLLPFPGKIMFLSGGCIYGLSDTDSIHFARVNMEDEPLLRGTFDRINCWDKNRLVFSGGGLLFLFDIKTLKASAPIPVPGITAADRLGQNQAIVTLKGNDKLARVDLSAGRIVKKYPGLKDQYGENMLPSPASIYHLKDQRFIITSPSAGAYVFDAHSESLKRYVHDPLDDRTIASNSSLYLFSDSGGFFFITHPNAGLDYFKPSLRQATTTPSFRDKSTNLIYDSFISSIAEDAKGRLWLGAQKYLINWDAASGEAVFYLDEKSKALQNRGGIRTIHIDGHSRIWLGLSRGILVLDRQGKALKHIPGSGAGALPHPIVNKIVPAPDGRLWVCTRKGICFIDPHSFKVSLPSKDSPLGALSDEFCNTLFFPSTSEVWIGTWDGAYRIDLSSGATTIYTTDNGLLFNEVIGFEDDEQGNIYIGTRYGFHILSAGSEAGTSMESGKGLLAFKQINDGWPVDCHSMVKDGSGTIWFTNNDYLASYTPGTKNFGIYDARAGIGNSGFYFYAAHASRSDKLIFGTNKGITWFDPAAIHIPRLPISVIINGMETPDSLYRASGDSAIVLPFTSNTVAFSFSAINLLRSKPTFYQFMLEGADKSWIKTFSGQRVNYNKLKPGSYRFRVKVSGDNIHWAEASNPVAFYIKSPWWQRWWFIAACMLAVIGLAGLRIRQKNRKVRLKEEQLETEQAINYLASSIYEQHTVDAILWDVAKNCIGRLKFEDCVIYMKDEMKNILVQKAAWGPKTTDENKIIAPLEIPVGKGIVGSVALSRKAEIIPDTSRDERYTVDDKKRLSEITVPVLYNGNVIGIIDSEHSKKNFFTREHLSILTTIASLCANKIMRLKAEEEAQRAQLELLEQEREAVEAQLKSLRLQMNPHFLFNSLNSIQQMILAGEDRAATIYLSKFSRLLRLVLLHSDKATVTLKEELETLSLYVGLESLRFKEAFTYTITCDHPIDADEIKIPAMLIQPFAENAIWHGLMHKTTDRRLDIRFSENGEESLVCRVEDNGIGREAAGKINHVRHPGKGIAVAKARLKTYNTHHRLKSHVLIEDILDNGKAGGTRVTLVLPIL